MFPVSQTRTSVNRKPTRSPIRVSRRRSGPGGKERVGHANLMKTGRDRQDQSTQHGDLQRLGQRRSGPNPESNGQGHRAGSRTTRSPARSDRATAASLRIMIAPKPARRAAARDGPAAPAPRKTNPTRPRTESRDKAGKRRSHRPESIHPGPSSSAPSWTSRPSG